jgi:hypothetical protein
MVKAELNVVVVDGDNTGGDGRSANRLAMARSLASVAALTTSDAAPDAASAANCAMDVALRNRSPQFKDHDDDDDASLDYD